MNVKYSKDKTIHAVKYCNKNSDIIEYEFCDLLCEDSEEISFLDNYVLKLEVGNDYNDHNGSYEKEYKYTVYVLENDWIVYNSKEDRLFVVKDEAIKNYIEE